MKKIIAIITLCLVCIMFSVPVFALSLAGSDPVLTDNAGLLSADEIDSLTTELKEASAKYGVDFIAVTVNGTEGKDVESYTDDYLDNYLMNTYGSVNDKSGVVMLVDMGSRSVQFSAHGEAEKVFTNNGYSAMTEDVSQYLSNGDYAGAISEYCKVAGGMVDYRNQNGYAYGSDEDTEHNDEGSNVANYGIKGVIGVIAGLLGSFGITKGMKSQLTSVRSKANAADYFDRAQLRLNGQKDTFLYVNVSKIPIRTDPPGGGGGGFNTHTSSGGYSHTSGGGHF